MSFVRSDRSFAVVAAIAGGFALVTPLFFSAGLDNETHGLPGVLRKL